MQDTKLNTRINLCEHYSPDYLSQLCKIFPRLNSIRPTTNSFNGKFYIEKRFFYQMILEKIKNYFEIKQAFVIAESISIILKDLKTNPAPNKNKINTLPEIINNRYNNEFNHMKRCYSTKSNGKNKINEQSKRKTDYSFFVPDKDKSICDINNVFLDLDKNKTKQTKIKMVHFINEKITDNNKTNTNKMYTTKKSNLKKTKGQADFNEINSLDLNNSNLNNYTSRTRETSFDKTTKEISIRNKSNGNKSNEKKESNNNIIINNMNPINLKRKNDRIYDIIKLNDSYNNINDKNFDIFDFSIIVGKDNVLPLIGNYFFTLYNFQEFMNITKFRNFCEKISEGYINTNFYHNSIHAADVAHTCYIYLREGAVNEKIGLNTKSICALFLSCFCHDYKHPGFNNNYLIETKHPLALKYNDVSVLENMHISEAFNLINSDNKYNIFENLDNNDYKTFRKQMITCVLGTDMANHGKDVDFMKQCLKEDYVKKEEDNLNYMKLFVHSADISNPTKKFNTYYKWAKLVVEEFYYQGDKEKELGLKCSCDRNVVTLYKSQLGFIDYIITPFYELFVKVFPKLNFLKDNVEENRKKIKEMENESTH